MRKVREKYQRKKPGRTRVPDNIKDYPKTKLCTGCGLRRKITEFAIGPVGRHLYFGCRCRLCRNVYSRAYGKSHRAYHTAYKLKKRIESPWSVLRSAWKSARHRHIDGVQFTFEELKRIYNKQKGLCALSGIKMTWVNGTKKPLPTSLSIDRIKSGKGYTKKNVRLVCYSINSFRQSMVDSEMVEMAKAIVRHSRKISR